jgi:peptidoglycan/xylan/chitin deacetylase (PgdA/CDA1 family)
MGLHTCRLKSSIDRRDFVALLAAGMVSLLTGCHGSSPQQPALPAPSPGPNDRSTTTLPRRPLGPIPPSHAGPAKIVSHAATATSQMALTIDDGYCVECVKGYVEFADSTGIHLTFSPNGTFQDVWNPHADRLRGLIEKGQVQIGNHTWAHPNLLGLGDVAIRGQIERNEDWIERTFGITGRPWFRPPYGKHNAHIDGIAGSLGYTRILMWSGSFGDATLQKPETILKLADRWVKAGSIMLGHANHPTILSLFDQIQALIADRGLQPVTLDEMFGTSRATG